MNAGPQKAGVFRSCPSETCVFPCRGGRPGAEVQCFHVRSATQPKSDVFLRSNSTPPFGPLSGGRFRTTVRHTMRKQRFPIQKGGFTTARHTPREENLMFSRSSPSPAGTPAAPETRTSCRRFLAPSQNHALSNACCDPHQNARDAPANKLPQCKSSSPPCSTVRTKSGRLLRRPHQHNTGANVA